MTKSDTVMPMTIKSASKPAAPKNGHRTERCDSCRKQLLVPKLSRGHARRSFGAKR